VDLFSLKEVEGYMKLYSYCLRWDDGAAPNPFWGICTLAICKPAIRRTAKTDDWVVGLGSANSPIGDIADSVVYAMRVIDIRSLWGYDILCQRKYQGKIPDWNSSDFTRRVGDCIYDYSQGSPPKLRPSVHSERNRKTDLGGENALISSHFYYFGNQPVKLPHDLKPLVCKQQGHKVKINQPYAEPFVQWIESLPYEPNKPYGEPQLKSEFELDADIRSKCSERDLEDDDREICF
jgi:hypothetical protein